ncbi:nitrile hydratase subunit beta [Hoeflea sp. TYP-13]|uniref:nitrile hydratase subunit beta n=1 Tax=Hoeflea sp. TYP-13 TaxID=3230023 RepID=UPI0034C5DB6C
MDGIHDMGGTQGWGTVRIEPDEPVFADLWHGRTFALGLASMGVSGTNLDAFRHSLERLHPLDYLQHGYYGRWLSCAEQLCVDSGILAPGAVEARARRLRGEDVEEPADVETRKPQYERGGAGSLRDIDAAPKFAVGQPVRAKTFRKSGHTRLPAYIRGHAGVISAIRPAAVLPDSTAHFTGEDPQHVYTVEFTSTELWGEDSEPATLFIDMFESYLEAS